MASDATPVTATSLVQQAPTQVTSESSSGKSLPPGGHAADATAASAPKSSGRSRLGDVQAQVAFLNKFLNDSGKPNQFRVAPNSNSAVIQEINPTNGAVIADYPTIAFPALARSLGISSALIDELA